jgi:hypothetical protein
MSGLAGVFSSKGYITYAVDYRLACTDADLPTPEEAPLCNWPFQRYPWEGNGYQGAAVQDVQDAVSWADADARARNHNYKREDRLVRGERGRDHRLPGRRWDSVPVRAFGGRMSSRDGPDRRRWDG